jgi:hypothetical protein
VACNNQSYTGFNMGNWNRLKTIQKVSEQHTANNKTNELQKTTMLGTAHALGKVSLLKFTTFIMGSIVSVP